jgi:hypothetical protein
MPRLNQASRLDIICLDSIVTNIDSYWVKKTDLKLILQVCPNMRYLKGPFEALSDDNVDYILKALTSKNLLAVHHLYLCLTMKLKKLNLSFVKKSLMNDSELITFIGNNCYVSPSP